MQKKLFFIGMLCIALIMSSCKDDSSQPIKPQQFILHSGSGEVTNLNDYIESLYVPNLIGVIEFQSTFYNTLTRDYNAGIGTYRDLNARQNYAYANFRNSSNEGITLDNLVLNGCLLREYKKGGYAKDDPNPLQIYFNGQPNEYYMEFHSGNVNISGTHAGTVDFSAPVRITNIQRGDVVYKSQGFTVNWEGGSPSGKIVVEFTGSDFEEDVKDQPPGFYEIMDNKGSFTIVPERLHLNGYYGGIGPTNRYYDIKVTSYEPILHMLDNGTKIYLIGTSEYFTTVYYAD